MARSYRGLDSQDLAILKTYDEQVRNLKHLFALPFFPFKFTLFKTAHHPWDYIWRYKHKTGFFFLGQEHIHNYVRMKQNCLKIASFNFQFTNFTRRITGAVPDSDQTRSRGDLISKRISNLGSSKRQLSLVEFQKSLEIQENPLCSFWSQVPINLNTSVCYKKRNCFPTNLKF